MDDVYTAFKQKLEEAYLSLWQALSGTDRVFHGAKSHLSEQLAMGRLTQWTMLKAMIRIGLAKKQGPISRLKLLVEPDRARMTIANSYFFEAPALAVAKANLWERRQEAALAAERRSRAAKRAVQLAAQPVTVDETEEVGEEDEQAASEEPSPEELAATAKEDQAWAARWEREARAAAEVAEKVSLEAMCAALMSASQQCGEVRTVAAPAKVLWERFFLPLGQSLSVAYRALARLIAADMVRLETVVLTATWPEYEEPECTYIFLYAVLTAKAASVRASQ